MQLKKNIINDSVSSIDLEFSKTEEIISFVEKLGINYVFLWFRPSHSVSGRVVAVLKCVDTAWFTYNKGKLVEIEDLHAYVNDLIDEYKTLSIIYKGMNSVIDKIEKEIYYEYY